MTAKQNNAASVQYPADKGEKDGACNRGACLQRPATAWNKSTQRYYCIPCARRINEVCGEKVCNLEGFVL